MDASRVREVYAALAAHGVEVWINGGWGIDALLGRQTRVHDDLDLIVRLDDVARLNDGLGRRGYHVLHGSPPASVELVDAEGHQVDVHPVRFSASGEALYRMEDGEQWVFPPSSLTGRGSVGGRTVACLTPEFAMVCHTTGYALDAEHRADVAVLGARFGIPVPEHRTG